jgi:hypothetical protein
LTDELLDSDRSLVQLQAANRVFAAQAVLKNILEKNYPQENALQTISELSEL